MGDETLSYKDRTRTFSRVYHMMETAVMNCGQAGRLNGLLHAEFAAPAPNRETGPRPSYYTYIIISPLSLHAFPRGSRISNLVEARDIRRHRVVPLVGRKSQFAHGKFTAENVFSTLSSPPCTSCTPWYAAVRAGT